MADRGLVAIVPGLLGALAALTLTACGSHRSCELDTKNIILRAVVVDDADGVHAEVELANDAEGGYASLEICSDAGDTLTVNGKGAEEIYTGDHYFYLVDFDDPEGDYRVTFTRGGDGESLHADITAPPPFQIATPEPLAQVSRATPLELSWMPEASGEMLINIADELGVECLESGFEQSVPNVGEFSVPPQTLVPGVDQPEDGYCEVEVTLSRHTAGEVSSALSEISSIDAIVSRRRALSSVP